MKAKRVLSLLLSLVMILSMAPSAVFADQDAAAEAVVYLTVSNKGVLAADNDGNPMANREVTVTDTDADGVLTYHEALVAAHKAYNTQDGYVAENSDYGLSVTKVWGTDTTNTLFFANNAALTMGVGYDAVKDGDMLVVSVNKDYTYWADWYTFFDAAEKTVRADEEFTLNLKGHLGMAYLEQDLADVPLGGVSVGTWNDGGFVAIDDKVTDADGNVTLSFNEPGTYYVTADGTVSDEVTDWANGGVTLETGCPIIAPVCVVTVEEYPDACITVPDGAELFVGFKGGVHFVDFTEMVPAAQVDNGDTTSYYFELDDNKTYNYRVSSEDYITYAGKFKKQADFTLDITSDMLADDNEKTTVDRDLTSNNGYNVADIYLNINPQGYLKLSSGETYQIVSLRNWEAVDSVTANYFIEPDYHYTVIDEAGQDSSSVVTVGENGMITAVGSGTAIVLVTYDAINLDFGSGKELYGAIWPENTGVFVVSVDSADSGIETGMTINEGKNTTDIKLSGDSIDAEHDCIYYIGDSGEYTFIPITEEVEVSVANPVVDTQLSYIGFETVEENADGSYTVPLKHGRNIVKVEKDGTAEYQVITAKHVTVSVNGGEPVHPGDALSITFDTLYHPANKLAGVYNMNAIAVYTDVDGYEEKLVGASSGQYNFASNQKSQNVSNVLKEKNVWGVVSYEKDSDLIVPADYENDKFVLRGGMLYLSGWGDSYGNHRGITYTDGKAPNLSAAAKLGWMGALPDIEIAVTPSTGDESSPEPGEGDDTTGDVDSGSNDEDSSGGGDTSGSSSSDGISVYFTLLGDDKHGENDSNKGIHTNKAGNLDTWIAQSVVSVDNGSYVIDVIKKALDASGIAYICEDNYISSVRGLGEMDNGSLSGWMYTLNGEYPELGVAEQVVKSGDKIVFHYTDDYTQEQDFETDDTDKESSGGSNSSGSSRPGNSGGVSTGIKFVDSNVIVPAVQQTAVSEVGFDDVAETQWYYEPVKYVVEKGVMKGVSDSDFSPDSNMSRAMLVTVLYRLENEPQVEVGGFDDVASDAYYAQAVAWASKNGITSGVAGKSFAPELNITREQIAVFLYRYAQHKNIDVSVKGDTASFVDADSISPWAQQAMEWAIGSGIINGSGGNLFAVNNATRAEVAAMLMRFIEK